MFNRKKKKVKNSVRVTWKDEKENMKGMTFREKVDHLWTYYKEYLWIGAVVLLLLVGVVTSVINAVFRETIVTGINVNVHMEQAGMNYLSKDYHAKIGARDFWDKVSLEYTQFDPLQEVAGDEDDYYASQAIYNKVAAEIIDYFIMDRTVMDYFTSMDIFMDLREFFTPEELAQLDAEGRLQYAREEGKPEEETWVVAVDITNTQYIKDNSNLGADVLFAVAINAPNPDQCREIWNHINAWGK